MNKNICIVRANPKDDVSQILKQRGYHVYGLYKGFGHVVSRTIRKLWLKYRLPFASIWFEKSVLDDSAQRVFVFESLLTRSYLVWLIQHKKDASIAVWYWNIVKNTIDPRTIMDLSCTFWSFSRMDCKKYGLRFNPPPYFHEMEYQSTEECVDICFVGKDKGRLEQILKWKQVFEAQGLSTEFYITPDHPYNKNPNYSKPISYKQSVEISARAKAIFDYIEIDNSGQSMRIMEALFTNKKIITNNKLIVDYDFYCPENFFILHVDPIEKLKDFMVTPYKKSIRDVKMRYDFDSFITRFWEDDKESWWYNNE